MYRISKCLLLAEVLVLVGEFLHHFQGVGLDVLLKHLRGGVAGDLHNVVQTHAGQVGHLVVVALQDVLELSGARDCDFGTGLMLPDVVVVGDVFPILWCLYIRQ